MYKSLFIIVSIVFTSVQFTIGQVAETECNGEWNNPRTWKDERIPEQGDSVFIRHYVRFMDTLELNYNFIEIDFFGELCGNQHLMITSGSKLVNYGILNYNTISLDDTLFNYGHITTTYLLITDYLINENGGSMIVQESFSCFDRAVCTPAIIRVGDSLRCNLKADSYEWYFEEEQIFGASERSILPENLGHYKVATVDGSGTLSQLSDPYFYVLTSTVTDELSQVSVYPNPNNGVFKITSDKSFPYVIYDAYGRRLVFDTTISGETIDILNFGKGVYFIQIGKGKTVRKIVVN